MVQVTAEIEDESGEIIKTFEVTGEMGINRIEWDLVEKAAKYRRSAYKGGTQLFPAGKYVFRIKSSGSVTEKPFAVLQTVKYLNINNY